MSLINLAQACVDRTLMATGLDDAIFTSHWQGGGPDLTSAERASATNAIKTFWIAVGSRISTKYLLREVKWYTLESTPPYKTHFAETVLIAGGAGQAGTSGGGVLSPQTAMSVTFKTSSRRNWGRFYIPGQTFLIMDSTAQNGCFNSADVDTVATAAKTLVTTSSPSFVIWSGTLGHAEAVTQVQVDNVVDVIRSRRLKKATYKKQLAVP